MLDFWADNLAALCPAAGGGGGPFVQDSFTDTAGVLLQNHIGEVGATWSRHSFYTTDSAVISDANRVRGVSNTSYGYYPSGTPAGADYEVRCIMRVRNLALFRFGVGLRWSTSANSGYLFEWNGSTSLWRIVKVQLGAPTELDTAAATLVDEQDYEITARIQGSTLTMLVDDVEVCTASDATFAAAGVPLLFLNGSANETANYHADSFEAQNL